MKRSLTPIARCDLTTGYQIPWPVPARSGCDRQLCTQNWSSTLGSLVFRGRRTQRFVWGKIWSLSNKLRRESLTVAVPAAMSFGRAIANSDFIPHHPSDNATARSGWQGKQMEEMKDLSMDMDPVLIYASSKRIRFDYCKKLWMSMTMICAKNLFVSSALLIVSAQNACITVGWHLTFISCRFG